MSIQIYQKNFVPKYENGKWTWNDATNKLEFKSNRIVQKTSKTAPSTTSIGFKKGLTQSEEIIFIRKFQRSPRSKDADVIILQDIKDLLLFLAPANKMFNRFIDLFHTYAVDDFLSSLIIYFEYFLKIWEFMLIRRDEVTRKFKRKVRNVDTGKVEVTLSEYLSQYRLLLARSYSRLLLGEGDSTGYHHMNNKMNTSYSGKDRHLIETLITFAIECVWIAMHRKNYKIIEFEINRLFRSMHFNVSKNDAKHLMNLTSYEENLLYGENNVANNFLSQRSPVINEILNCSTENSQLLWLGYTKYMGDDPRTQQLELEYVTNDAQLMLADVQHGILGHPKHLYDTMLNLNWNAVRCEKFSENYDPYRIMAQPFLQIPITERPIHKQGMKPQHFKLHKVFDELMIKTQARKWKNKEKISTDAKSDCLLPSTIEQGENFAKMSFT